jgi:4-hydroxyphenylacetate 3-monooxygenase
MRADPPARPPGTGARRGADLIRALRETPPDLWYAGERVDDPTEHPAFRNGLRTLAALYDLQWEHPADMLTRSSTTGHAVGGSFLIPRTTADLATVSRALRLRAEATFGMMGRLPDYINRAMAAYAAGAAYLGEADQRFAANAVAYHEYMQEHDLCLTHTLSSPQANRAVAAAQQGDPFLAAKVKDESDAGIIIRGCRMLATLPLSDEIMVFPSTVLKNTPEDVAYSYGFCIPSRTDGLRFLCRESVDYGRSTYDHPLGSRFEEMDAVVVFDDVFVPWERVFLYRDVARCNAAYLRTGAVVHMAHQVTIKNVAKTEYLLGLASLMADAIAIEGFQHIQEKLAEIWVNLETMRALLRAAEADAAVDEWGVMRPAWAPLDAARNLYPRLYPRMIEIIQQMGAAGLVAMPTEKDVRGPRRDDIARYFQAARAEAHDRIPLFRLAWDTAVSAFGARQVLYERFFFGDPVRMAGALVANHDRTRAMDRVRELLAGSREEAESAARA